MSKHMKKSYVTGAVALSLGLLNAGQPAIAEGISRGNQPAQQTPAPTYPVFDYSRPFFT